METKIDFDDLEEFAIEEDTELSLDYSLQYILWMLEYSDIFDQSHVHLSNQYPMQIYYSIDESSESYIRFYVAPQISDY